MSRRRARTRASPEERRRTPDLNGPPRPDSPVSRALAERGLIDLDAGEAPPDFGGPLSSQAAMLVECNRLVCHGSLPRH
jgi:hypothetical protein